MSLKDRLDQKIGKKINYLHALAIVHDTIKPRNYLEIGCRFGDSLALAQCPSVGVDPNMRLKPELQIPAQLFEVTSDDFFQNNNPSELFGEPIHCSYIDGMHLAEFALRDFINLEKNSSADGIIMLDDILPGRIEIAGREQVPGIMAWCGDVYKVLRILQKHRPDLKIDVFDVSVKGLGIIYNLDPTSTVLSGSYDEIEAEIFAGGYEVSDAQTLREEFAVRDCRTLRECLENIAA